MGALLGIVKDPEKHGTSQVSKAAQVILEYTKQKPSTKTDVTVQRAEDFLDNLSKESLEHDIQQERLAKQEEEEEMELIIDAVAEENPA